MSIPTTGGSAGIGPAVVATVALAAQSLAVRRSTRSRSIVEVMAVVFAVNLLVLLPITTLRHGGEFGLTPASVAAFAVAGVLGSLLARAALFTGIERLGASRAEPLKSTFPLVAVVLAVTVTGEAVSAALVAGVLLLVGGAVVVSWDARASPVTDGSVLADLKFPLIAAVLLGIDPVFTKVGLATGTPPLVAVTVRVIAATAGFGLYLLWRRVARGVAASFAATRWSLLAGITNTTYLVAYLAALDSAPVSVVTPILGASPLLVLVGAAAFAQREEQVTARLGLAVVVLVLGTVLVLTG